MSPARYIFRMDDISPTMDWRKFEAIMSIFARREIKPLLAIIPDNRDPKLNFESARPDFWEKMRLLQDEDKVEFAQHGFQHILKSRPGAALFHAEYGPRHDRTEFAGEPFEEQYRKIAEGRRTLIDAGIKANYWVSPNHTFDRNTLIVLRTLGFTAVSDGFALYPFEQAELVFVPQQFWRPRWMPFGVITICLHPSLLTANEIQRISNFVERNVTFTRFSTEVKNFNRMATWTDSSFRSLYIGARKLRRLLLLQT